MQYNRLGDTGLIISRLAFGAMTFGSAAGTIFEGISKVDQKLASELVSKALDVGINHFNTADVYTGGQSEEMLSRALGAKRKDVVIATKAGFRTGEALLHTGLSRQHIFASADWIPNFDTRWTWICGCDLWFRGCRSFPFPGFKHSFVRTRYRRVAPQSGSITALRRKC